MWIFKIQSLILSVSSSTVDGVFTEWGAYGECDVTCGGGIQWRSRSCKGPFYGGADCVGPHNDSRECNTHECPIDGVFTEWGAYGECDVTCGGGIQWRSRSCEGPSFYGGADCVGQHNGSRECNTHECPIPGSWFLWSEWSPCTVSCGGGSKHRKRMCDWDSFGDLACEGDAEEVEDCHTFGCEPLAKHCADLASRGLNHSCTADVDPDGEDSTFGPVRVECDFDTEPGKAITTIHHDQETKTKVDDQESAGAYKAFLTYCTGWDEAVWIADESSECAQFMRWDCFGAVIHDTYDPHMWMTFWKNRKEQVANYFGGAIPGSGNCACEETNSCHIASLPCNCDTNADMWLYDEGFVTDKAELPIHSFYAGDTGGLSEVGYVTLGPLLCSGLANSTSSPGPRLHNNGTDAMQQILKPLLV